MIYLYILSMCLSIYTLTFVIINREISDRNHRKIMNSLDTEEPITEIEGLWYFPFIKRKPVKL